MDGIFKKLIVFGYFLLFFAVPLIVLPYTSELFEFNKIVLVYFSVGIITLSWVARMIVERKIIFRRTMLDVPLVIFLLVCSITTYYSVDTRTSIFGYYSRFNGGLISILSYSLLYWAFVSNMNKKDARLTTIFFITSAVLVCIYGVLQHFGIDKDIWVQDVQERIFSTLGQPNWLAAWLVSIIPITYALILNKPDDKKVFKISLITLLILLVSTLLFTKSRSGIIAFVFSQLTFFLFLLFSYLKNKKILGDIKNFVLINIFIVIPIFLLIGTPWTPKLSTFFIQTESTDQIKVVSTTSLETGGTDSGKIRKIVWKGALDIWKSSYLVGSGLETFAHVYYQHRPTEHNITSEWDYLYNKAHNEYLNYLATTGLVGLTGYLLLILMALLLITLNWKENFVHDTKRSYIHAALFSGLLGIFISNIFGFSVVVTSLTLFLYPAISVSLLVLPEKAKKQKTNHLSYLGIIFILFGFIYLTTLISRYWYGDFLYTKGRTLNDQKEYKRAKEFLLKAINLSPDEPIYLNELAQSDSELAIQYYREDNPTKAEEYATDAIIESETALELSPRNLNIRRSNAAIYIKLSELDENLSSQVVNSIEKSIEYSPTDAKLYYNLGLAYAKIDNTEKAIEILEQAIDLKPDYRDARLALSIIYSQNNQKDKAVDHLNYILENINPEDRMTKDQLREITGN